MKIWTKALLLSSTILIVGGAALAFQKPFREYPGQDNIELPPDWKEPGEWIFARLMYPNYSGFGGGFGGFRRRGGNYKFGNSSWTTDYNAADRHMSAAVRRLTRVHVRSVEQPVDLDDGDDVMNYPWLYAVEVGRWELTDSQIANFRDFLLRGGFFMCDDFHGTAEWEIFMQTMRKVFPDREVVDIPQSDQIFQIVYPMDVKYQVPGAQYLRSGRTYEQDGYSAVWRGIYDDHGRLMVAICHNMDLGDAWEYADDPQYDEKFAQTALRIATNYVVYSMTH